MVVKFWFGIQFYEVRERQDWARIGNTRDWSITYWNQGLVKFNFIIVLIFKKCSNIVMWSLCTLLFYNPIPPPPLKYTFSHLPHDFVLHKIGNTQPYPWKFRSWVATEDWQRSIDSRGGGGYFCGLVIVIIFFSHYNFYLLI